jgi:hypothetical protein
VSEPLSTRLREAGYVGEADELKRQRRRAIASFQKIHDSRDALADRLAAIKARALNIPALEWLVRMCDGETP